MTADPKKLALWGVAGLALLGTLWLDFRPRREASETVVTSEEIAEWLKAGNMQRLHAVAFTNPPQSVYDVGDFLVEEGSPRALDALRSFCDAPEGAVVVAELADKLPVAEALHLCRDLAGNADERVRHGALSTLFWIVARPQSYAGPWPEGMNRPSASPLAVKSARARWKKDQTDGGDNGEGFEEWMYKDAVTAFLCNEDPDFKLGRKSEKLLESQLDAELQKRFGFQLIP